jgi:hypothetical protein
MVTAVMVMVVLATATLIMDTMVIILITPITEADSLGLTGEGYSKALSDFIERVNLFDISMYFVICFARWFDPEITILARMLEPYQGVNFLV